MTASFNVPREEYGSHPDNPYISVNSELRKDNIETLMLSFWWISWLAALEVVILTTSSAASEENFIKMTF